MPHVSADLESAERFAALPKTDDNNPPLHAVVKEEFEGTSKSGAPMVQLRFEITSGDHQGRELPGMGGWLYIMAGGKKEDGSPYDISRLLETGSALRAEYRCRQCGETTTAPLAKEKVKGAYNYLCPKCGKRAVIEYTGSWTGLRCRLRIGVEKMQNSDEDRNVIAAVLPAD